MEVVVRRPYPEPLGSFDVRLKICLNILEGVLGWSYTLYLRFELLTICQAWFRKS